MTKHDLERENKLPLAIKPPPKSHHFGRTGHIGGAYMPDYSVPAFWMSINPSDLKHLPVLLLAGVKYSRDAFLTTNSTI
jgi:hypothetical protein